MARDLTLSLTFKIGTIEEIGMGGFKQPWIDAEQDGRKYDLTCGAGLGNSFIEASVHEGKRALYAQASITPLAADIFDALTVALRDAAVPGG